MKGYLDRWYITILILPILVNLFTNTITWTMLKHNPILSFLIISIFINIVLIGEFFLYISQTKKSNSDFVNDKIIIERLVKLLNLDENQIILKNTNHVEDLPYSYTKSFKDFIAQVEKPQNHINDNVLNQKISDLKNALDIYIISLTRYMSSNVYDDFNSISIHKDLKETNNKLYIERIEELDNNANIAYRRLEGLLFHLRQKNII